MIQDRRSLPPADHKSSASLNENGCRFLLADLRSAEDQLICDTFLVILLVILCTGIPCRQLRRNAIRYSLASNSFVTLYATGVRGLARPCSCGKFGLKIRRGQPRGGSTPPPGTIKSMVYQINASSDAFFCAQTVPKVAKTCPATVARARRERPQNTPS
jgi:hypothetical protein